MKLKITIIFFLVASIVKAQGYCPPNGVSTNPLNPVNTLQPSYLNHFNWASGNSSYGINSYCNPNSFTPNPFESNQSELLFLSLNKDMKPEDGWEAVAYNLGYDNDNNALQSRPEHTYLMLYNKHTGILRVLVKWCRNTNYNGAMLTLKFAPGFQTNLLDMAHNEKALDVLHVQNPSFSTTLKFYNDNNSWSYADFKLNYDPCTCSFNEPSRLALYTELISNSSIELTGKMTGMITSVSQGQGTASSEGNFWKTANNVNNKMMKVHGGIQSFTKDYEKIYKNLSDGGVTINAINSIGNFMKNNQFLKAGLKAVPYVSTGVKFLSSLLGGGASGTGPIELAPLSVNLDVSLKGTIATQDPMHNQTIGLPGSQKQNILIGVNGGQPLYNEALGVFSLINTPVMYYTETVVLKEFINREEVTRLFDVSKYYEYKNKFNFVNRNYKLSGETLKYAINPASGLVLEDAEVMLVVEYEKPGLQYAKDLPVPATIIIDTNVDNGLPIIGTDMGPAVDIQNNRFQNVYKPIGSNNYKNDYSFSYLYYIEGSYFNEEKELKYDPNAHYMGPQFSCMNRCSWTPSGYVIPFAYEQSQPVYQDVYFLKKNHFSSKSLGSKFPSLLTPLPEFLAPRVKGFKLKLVLNLKRTDNPNAQNILYVVTYPVDLKPAPAGYNMSGSDYIADAQNYAAQVGFNPATPGNKFLPVTTEELTTFCTSNTYRNNRISNTGRIKNVDNILFKQDGLKVGDKPILYPVPAKESLHVILNNCEIISIIDFQGKLVSNDLNTNQKEKDGEELVLDISRYAKGIYLLTYRDTSNQIRSMKFTIE
ncbi:T9SS type A sorting domain-containing protein [Flavobacterium sp. '19STA2R22 D10 B1']|uniref:T9SS type A sorting domain-containing protein n=1 Tax=Flavobacterium aerium TaxID=3037261 RepID=UPI00278C624A|nr:T9SS type A sorting domain-containing protein [Flavobacterium sp. '19STA2R22 D10 B1']